jgi:hypothetical protein
MAFHADVKPDCGFVGSKHKTQVKYKIHAMEIVQASSDFLTA